MHGGSLQIGGCPESPCFGEFWYFKSHRSGECLEIWPPNKKSVEAKPNNHGWRGFPSNSPKEIVTILGFPRAVLMHSCPYFGHTYCRELWSCIWANKFCKYQSLKLIAVILPPEKWVAKGEVFLFFLGEKPIFSGGKTISFREEKQTKNSLELGEASLKRLAFWTLQFLGGWNFSCIKTC